MENLLTTVNKKIRESKPFIENSNLYAVWIENRCLQIFIRSQGCRFSKAGMCIMCDYGISEQNLSLHETAIAMNYILKNLTEDIHSIGVGSFGSFFDIYEISEESRKYILKTIARTKVKDITIETFYTTVTPEVLDEVEDILKGKDISIEMGLESSNPDTQRKSLNKIINTLVLKEKMDMIQQKGFSVILNILFGAPFLSLEQQIQDSLQSVLWSFENGADIVALFPINIKPYTLLYELYKGGYYEPISHWGFIMLLDEIPEKYLNRINFSWYGNRESNYANEELVHIMPRACDKCREDIINFYETFLTLDNSKDRKELIRGMRDRKFSCKCQEEEKQKRNGHGWDENTEQEALNYLREKYYVL